uniref:Uncharacterized protein n=1 Tax=Anguilla anguilla TaxID=7936 RepID=A0A0E9QTC8_ANGAN
MFQSSPKICSNTRLSQTQLHHCHLSLPKCVKSLHLKVIPQPVSCPDFFPCKIRDI